MYMRPPTTMCASIVLRVCVAKNMDVMPVPVEEVNVQKNASLDNGDVETTLRMCGMTAPSKESEAIIITYKLNAKYGNASITHVVFKMRAEEMDGMCLVFPLLCFMHDSNESVVKMIPLITKDQTLTLLFHDLVRGVRALVHSDTRPGTCYTVVPYAHTPTPTMEIAQMPYAWWMDYKKIDGVQKLEWKESDITAPVTLNLHENKKTEQESVATPPPVAGAQKPSAVYTYAV